MSARHRERGLLLRRCSSRFFLDITGRTDVYFEVTVAIITLVLMGRMLEAKRRERTHRARGGERKRETEGGGGGDRSGHSVARGEKIPVDGLVIEGAPSR